MSQFEKYHPILTAHYALDWLTKSRAIDVFHLYQLSGTTPLDMPTTATQINQTMREIFRDQKLVWGVSDRSSGQFVGQAGFDPIDTTTHRARLRLDLLPANEQPAALTELYQHLVAFGTTELALTRLTVQLTTIDAQRAAILTSLGFTTSDQLTFQYQK